MTDEILLSKLLLPGSLPADGYGGPARHDVFVRVEYARRPGMNRPEPSLAFTGVIGSKRNGDAWGSSGQIAMGFAHRDPADDDSRYASPTPASAFEWRAGWDADRWLDLLDDWKRWHGSDMRPGCEHQRALGWADLAREERTLYHWRLTPAIEKEVRDALADAAKRLRAGGTVKLPGPVGYLASLPARVTTSTEKPPPTPGARPGTVVYVPNGPAYEGDAYNRPSDVKALGWLRPDEHPDGLLTRPCPECGYKYGTAWIVEPVPDDVIARLAALPDATKPCPWETF